MVYIRPRREVVCVEPTTLTSKLVKDRRYSISEPEKKTGLVSVFDTNGRYVCISYEHRFHDAATYRSVKQRRTVKS